MALQPAIEISMYRCDIFYSLKSNSHRFAGTAILLKPAIILGGVVQHECPLSRSIGYFLEPVIALAPFAKRPLDLTLKGITTDDHDLSVRPGHPFSSHLFTALSQG